MRVIILAAGMGTRLRPLTLDRPKCLVKIHNQSILDHQLEILRKNKLEDIYIVGGYLAESLRRFGLKMYINHDYSTTNMVYTLFHAEDLFDGSDDILISYGDIVYESKVISSLLSESAPISVTADKSWLKYWSNRMDNPLADAETFITDNSNYIKELGQKPQDYNQIQAQFIGLIKISKDYATSILMHWKQLVLSNDKNAKNMYKNVSMCDFP